MALPVSVQLPVISPFTSPRSAGDPRSSMRFKLPPASHRLLYHNKGRNQPLTIKAIEETGDTPESETASTQESPSESESQPGESSAELGAAIKEAMRQRKEAEGRGGGFWSGVVEEIREIEWPAFGKVLGTTGVVLGVIAGSSVVLLTLNAVLAELSDRVFAGRGVQDFFG